MHVLHRDGRRTSRPTRQLVINRDSKNKGADSKSRHLCFLGYPAISKGFANAADSGLNDLSILHRFRKDVEYDGDDAGSYH